MDSVNLWNCNFGKEFYIFFDNLNDYFDYIYYNNNIDFSLKNNYSVNNEPVGLLEEKFYDNNTNLVFTDSDHPIAVCNNGFCQNYVDKDFFDNHKDDFIKFYKNKLYEDLANSNSNYISLVDFVLDDNIFRDIINRCNCHYKCFIIDGVELPSQFINELKDKHIDFTLSKNLVEDNISSSKAFLYYSFDEFENMDTLRIDINDLNDREISNIDNFIYLKQNAIIHFNEIDDEKNYFNTIKNIVNILSKHNRNYNIEINVDNRELLKQVNLFENLPNNINFLINNDLHNYDVYSFLKEEEKLDKMVEPIKNADLSPFEKYLAVYNLVKQFKEYKEHPNDKDKSRYLRFILDNEYIVCVGFSNLLEVLLNKVGIPSYHLSVSVDISYDDGFTMDNTLLSRGGHARNMVNIDDDKYNIHGIYEVDSTWDNDLEQDLYFNSLMTFDRKKEARRLEFLNDIDLLFDFHDVYDFKDKISYYIKKNIDDDIDINIDKDKYNDMFFDIYKDLFNSILIILKKLDFNKRNYFYNRYYNIFNKFSSWNNTNIDDATNILNDFLAEYFEYIITKVNKKVDDNVILDAALVVKRKVNGYDDLQLKEWLEEQKNVRDKLEIKEFPYKYSPDFKEAYLEDREEVSNKHIR